MTSSWLLYGHKYSQSLQTYTLKFELFHAITAHKGINNEIRYNQQGLSTSKLMQFGREACIFYMYSNFQAIFEPEEIITGPFGLLCVCKQVIK